MEIKVTDNRGVYMKQQFEHGDYLLYETHESPCIIIHSGNKWHVMDLVSGEYLTTTTTGAGGGSTIARDLILDGYEGSFAAIKQLEFVIS